MKLAQRLNKIAPFHVMDLLAKAKHMQSLGRDVIHLEVGEPDFSTVEPIVQAGVKALQEGATHYTAATGLPELKRAIAQFYRQRYDAEVAAERIVITPGASGALQLVTALLADEGENLLLADPGYPCNRHFLRLVGADGLLVPTQAEDGFQLTPENVQAHWSPSTIGALVASPANPTGTVLSEEELHALHQHISDRDGVLIVDEIYHGLTYDTEAATAVELGENVFVINSFSKYFGMTGWRLGWVVAPQWAVPELDKLAQNVFLAPSTIAQHAALAALEPDTLHLLEQRRQVFTERRDYLLPALKSLGFHIPAQPQGAFYIYCDISGICGSEQCDSMAFCLELLEQEGVAITPGIDFGEQNAQQFVRFAYTADVERLQEAVKRIQRFVERFQR